MNIAAYCRVSTDTSDQLNSLDTQKKFFTDYTAQNGHTLVRLYADEGISGTKIKNRKEFLRLMQDAAHGLFDMVVVKDISRFARNTVDLLQSIRTLKALGIETTFLTANMTVLGQSEFVLTIFGALAQEESANTSKRVKFGKKMNAEKGRVPNLVYGYDKIGGDYFNLTINQAEAETIKQIFHWYTEEGCGTAQIAAMLNQKGRQTKRNCAFSQNAVCRILGNAIYTGKIINGKQEVADFLTGIRREKAASEWMVTEKAALQIISPEQFATAQKILSDRGAAFRTQKERQSNKHLFSTLIKCRECGWSFRRVVKTYQNTYIRWVCSGRNGKGTETCPNATAIDEGELLRVLEQYFSETLQKKKNLRQHIIKEFTKICRAKADNETHQKELTDKLAKLHKTRTKYLDMYTDDIITRSELNEKMNTLKPEIENLEKEQKLVADNLDKGIRLEELIQQAFQSIEDITALRPMTNQQLKRIIQKIEVDRAGNVDIHLRIFDDLGMAGTTLDRSIYTQPYIKTLPTD